MERYEVIKTIKKLMIEYNIALNDLVEMTTADGKYPFEVLYTDGQRSWVPTAGKEIWGVVIGKCALSLVETPKKLSYEMAQTYCLSKAPNGFVSSAGSEVFWQEIMRLDEKVNLLNAFIISLGGTALDGDYWISEAREDNYGTRFFYVTFSVAYNWEFLSWCHKPQRLYYARPVCAL